MADVQIKDLTQVLVNGTSSSDIYILQIYDSVVGDFVTRKITAADLGACLVSQIGYTLVLETSAKTVLAAINEVNAKTANDITYENNTSIKSALDTLVQTTGSILDFIAYKTDDIVNLESVVLPIYEDSNNVIHFTIPLSKPVGETDIATISGNFTIDGALTNDDLDTVFTVATEITDIGVNVSLTPINTVTITKPYIVANSGAQILFEEEES